MMGWIHVFLQIIGIRTHRRFRLALRGFLLVFGLVAAFFTSVFIKQGEFKHAFCSYLVVIVSAFLEFVIADVLAEHSFPFNTERKLELMEKRLGRDIIGTITELLNELINEFKACDTGRISACVHVTTELAATMDQPVRGGLLQLTDYVGPASGKKGRVTLITQGLIGRCARTGSFETVNFADSSDYAKSMVREFGFTQIEAERHTKSARSYLAYPLKHSERTVGVLYFFSTEPQVFPYAVDIELLDKAASSIVNYIKLLRIF